MNNNLLTTFLTVIERGSFSAAAKHLNISQPAVTLHIQSLEEELGQSLLDRRYRRITLTEAGQLLVPYAQKVLLDEQDIFADMAALSGEVAGTLTIASSTTPGDYLIPELLGGFLQRYPRVRPQLMITSSQEAARAVDACEANIGITGARIKGYRVDYSACGHDELIPIAAPTSVPGMATHLKVSDLAAWPWVMRGGNSGTQQQIQKILADNHVPYENLNCIVELGNAEAIIGAVEGGLGIAIVSKSAAEKALWLGTVVELPVLSRPWKRRFYLARPRMTLTHAANAFAEYLHENLK
jgi:DNA-binding transcriptional LysR family regulator